MITEVTAGFIVGLAGSLHCIGMCGPIAATLPAGGRGRWQYVIGRMFYNGGRTVTYMLMGMMAGLAGQRFAVAGFQQEVSVAVGGLMVLTALLPGIMNRMWANIPYVQTLNAMVKKAFTTAFGKRTLSSMFTVGMVNGFLPCGLVYMALAGAAAAGTVSGGIALMAGFGAGTIPLMLAVSVAGSVIPLPVRRRLLRLAPAFVFVVGVMLMLRGLNLGIPMVSPKVPAQTAAAAAPCCPM